VGFLIQQPPQAPSNRDIDPPSTVRPSPGTRLGLTGPDRTTVVGVSTNTIDTAGTKVLNSARPVNIEGAARSGSRRAAPVASVNASTTTSTCSTLVKVTMTVGHVNNNRACSVRA
jgi:hypothetical protein